MNKNPIIGSHEFPNSQKNIGKDKFSLINKLNFDNEKNSIKNNFQNLSENEEFLKDDSFIEEKYPFCSKIPPFYSNLWLKGFIWKGLIFFLIDYKYLFIYINFLKFIYFHKLIKFFFFYIGVYLKIISKKNRKQLKNLIQSLKNISVESYFSGNTFKINDDSKIKSSEKQTKNSFFLNLITPLICYIESSSWILFGSPVIIQNRINEEKENLINFNNLFKNSIFSVKELNINSFTLYDCSIKSNLAVKNSLNLIYTNIEEILPKIPNSQFMLILHSDININIVYLDCLQLQFF